MQYFEVKFSRILMLPFYVRYVDDCCVLINRDQLDINHSLSDIISINHYLQFTFVKEIDNCLPSCMS